MAITRLTDFITVATNEWTYGDSAFKYEGEVNQDHDTVYPLMVMTPPTSRMPDIYEGWEHYNVEMEFYNSYQTSAQNAVTLQQRWDNLQDLALEWLDNVLINYSGGTIVNPSTSSPTPTQVYIDKESLQIERIKNNKNDKLCRITMRFDMRMFTRCFTPKSIYPDTISDLSLWLRADSDVTFNIPTKKVSSWSDQTGTTNNNLSESTSSAQPLRYGYDGPSDKSQILFDGASDNMDSLGNNPFDSGEMSFFFVCKKTSSSVGKSVLLNINRGDTTIFLASIHDGTFYVETLAGGNSLGGSSTCVETDWMIGYCQLKENSPTNYSVITSVNDGVESNDSGTFQDTLYNTVPYNVGCYQSGAGAKTLFFNGAMSEVIGYNKSINSDEKSQVLNYLNNKYKIY